MKTRTIHVLISSAATSKDLMKQKHYADKHVSHKFFMIIAQAYKLTAK